MSSPTAVTVTAESIIFILPPTLSDLFLPNYKYKILKKVLETE